MLSNMFLNDTSVLSRGRDIICSCCNRIGHRCCDCNSSLIYDLECRIIDIINTYSATNDSSWKYLFDTYWVNKKSGIVFALCYSNQIIIELNNTSYDTFKLSCKLLKKYYYVTYFILPVLLTKTSALKICPKMLKNKVNFMLRNELYQIQLEHMTNNKYSFVRSDPIQIPVYHKSK